MEPASERKRDRLALAGVVAAFSALYLATLCKSVYWYDSAEYVAGAATLGITHPPGYPMYTLVGHVFTWLPIDPAVAVNAMSAVFGVVAVAFVFLIARVVGMSRFAAVVGASTLGASTVFWFNCVIAEVYTSGLAVGAVVLYVLLRAQHHHRTWPVVGAAFLAGIGLGFHLFVATFGLGYAVLVWTRGTAGADPFSLTSHLSRRLLTSAACAVAACVGAANFLYVYFRSQMDPPLNSVKIDDWDTFLWAVRGGNYKDWRVEEVFPDRALEVATIFNDQFLIAGLVLAAIGVVTLARRSRVATVALALCAAGNTWYFVDYRVHDLEVFFLPAFAIFAVFIAAGVDGATALVQARIPSSRRESFTRLLRVVLALLPLSLVASNYATNDYNDFTEAEEFSTAMIENLPPDAVIIDFTSPPEWKYNAVFGMYTKLVLGKRTDVPVVPKPLYRLMIRLLREGRPIFAYHPEPRLLMYFYVTPYEPIPPLLQVVAPRPEPLPEPPKI